MILYAHYSAADAELHGTVTYLSPEGDEVICTCIGTHLEPKDDNYLWPDAISLGEVSSFVRSNWRDC